MLVQSTEREPIRQETDVVKVRHKVRSLTAQLRFGLVDQTKLITAASEIARNTLTYGKGGDVVYEVVERDGKKGVRLTFEDQGPGIEDLDRALTDGYTSGGGLGLGLSGSKRLVNEFNIESRPGEGTKITLLKWK